MQDLRLQMIHYMDEFMSVPRDYKERLEWMYDKYQLDDESSQQILALRSKFLEEMRYETIKMIWYEHPQFAPRPRAQQINKRGILNALGGNSIIRVYSEGAQEANQFMHMWVQQHLKDKLEQLLCTQCNLELNVYFQTPSSFNKIDVFLAELGLVRPLIKPDFDNIMKRYADAITGNIWLDDIFVCDASIHKYYSTLPRVECNLSFANMLGNKYQYKAVVQRKDFLPGMEVTYVGQF